MSIFPKQFISSVAETIGISNGVNDQVQSLLIEDGEYRLREIIYNSSKFMKHSKRKSLKVNDINSALIVKNVSPVFGYSSFSPEFKVSTITSGNGSNPQQLYYVDDAEIDLEELVNKALPPVPLEVTFTAHWLAVEGVQPRIVQNPTPSSGDKTQSVLQGLSSLPSSAGASAKAAADAPLVKQVLTTQLQTYYEKVTSGVLSNDSEFQQIALESLEQDPGIQALLPYFVVFISEQITNNLKELVIASAMIKLVTSLIKNPHLFLDPYLHQIIPAVITCVVAKHLAINSDHWTLRRNAAFLLKEISSQCSATYPGLQARITKTLVRSFLDTTKPPQTIYGSLYALWKLGPEVVDLLIIPSIPSLYLRTNSSPQTVNLVHEILKDHFDRMCQSTVEKDLGGIGVQKVSVPSSVRAEQMEIWKPSYGGFADAVFTQDVEMGN